MVFYTQFISNDLVNINSTGKGIDELITDALIPIESKMRTFLDESRTYSEIADHSGLEPHDVSSVRIRLFEV